MDRIIDAIEWCAATFVGIVALNIFLAVVLRKFFAWQIPDSYDIGKMLLGTLIFWGIAATSYRGSHITVDLLWTAASARWKRRIDVFATIVLLFVVAVQTIMLFDKVRATFVDHVLTYDLGIPTWPFYAVAWLGDVVGGGADRDPHLSARLPSRAISSKRAKRRSSNEPTADEQRLDRLHRLRRAVRADDAARAGRHGDGAGRRHRLQLSSSGPGRR